MIFSPTLLEYFSYRCQQFHRINFIHPLSILPITFILIVYIFIYFFLAFHNEDVYKSHGLKSLFAASFLLVMVKTKRYVSS